ncbi:Myotubularin- protein 3 [Mortierella alpina]|nr:Myotubularin- protein 3 [Mortierella alpina]
MSPIHFAWCLPGETVQAVFAKDIDFFPVNALGESLWDSTAAGSTSVPKLSSASLAEPYSSSHVRSAKQPVAQQKGSFASFLTAAGNTLHSISPHDSTDLPRHHCHQHRLQSQQHGAHSRSHTHPHHEPVRSTPPNASAASLPVRNSAPAAPSSRLVITNFRVCSLMPGPEHHEPIQLQVALGSIASITLLEHRITLALKFDSPQYIISQPTHGPPAIVEVVSILRRLVFNEETRTRFPYQMGQSVLHQQQGSKVAIAVDRGILWTAEDIFNVPLDRIDSGQDYRIEGLSAKESQQRARLGWTGGYDILQEFDRLGFDPSLWSVARINAGFGLSPTYPERFIMPSSFLANGTSSHSPTPGPTHHPQRASPASLQSASSMEQEEDTDICLSQLAGFRSSKRFPIICWKSPESGLVLLRSSQPMVGFLGARGLQDELYIRTVLSTAAKEFHQRKQGARVAPKLCIMDARAYTAAVANGYVGGGRENPDHYPNATISFLSLGNIHAIASSHQALLKAVSTQADSPNWFTVIESTGWLSHVSDLLKAAGREGIVGKMVDTQSSVLVHCTDGWDRTTQLVCLAQIMLDPFYRTIQGLRVLIEKEWLFCGHPFRSRTDPLPTPKKQGALPTAEESREYWSSSSTSPVIRSSPNGAKESLTFSHKWRRQIYPDPEPRLDTKPIPAFSYHIEPQPSMELPLLSHKGYPPAPKQKPVGSTSSPQPVSYPPQPPLSPPQPKHSPAPTVPISPSPVFLLFMTCLHHIVQQHPSRFEYNDYLLVVLARAAGGFSPFGDFMYNSEQERAQDSLRQGTLSIWKWIQENMGWFKNGDYIPERKQTTPSHGSTQWKDSVLHVQTGGRFTALWAEYYFNTTPMWFPDPRTVLSTLPPAEQTRRHKARTQRSSLVVKVLQDPWHASVFDHTQLQQLIFPGLLAAQNVHQQRAVAGAVTIPPSLALLKGQEMHMYYMLVQHLKARRRRLVQQAFLAWRRWANSKHAREAGWVGVSAGHHAQEDSALDLEETEDDEADTDKGMPRDTVPELKVVAARKGIEREMERIRVSGDFFRAGQPLEYEEESPDEDEDSSAEDSFNKVQQDVDGFVSMMGEKDGEEEAFDDFGFPVSTG